MSEIQLSIIFKGAKIRLKSLLEERKLLLMPVVSQRKSWGLLPPGSAGGGQSSTQGLLSGTFLLTEVDESSLAAAHASMKHGL